VQVTARDTTVPYSEPLEAYVIPTRRASSPPSANRFRVGADPTGDYYSRQSRPSSIATKRARICAVGGRRPRVINRQREIRQRAHDHGALSRHHTVALAADGEYRGLRWIDDRRERSGPSHRDWKC